MNINLLQSCKFGKTAEVSSFLQQARASNKDSAAILNSILDKENGKSSLHYAAESGHEDLVNLLLDQGANINIQNPKNGSTPLHLASFYGHTGVVSVLIKRGCNTNVSNSNQVTALHAACDNNKTACVEVLVKGGANMEAKDKKGATPLHYAVAQGNKETVEVLCKSGAFVNSVDQHSQTPLMWAGKSNQLSFVGQLLIQYGADVNATDKNGLSLTMDAKFRRQLAGFLKSSNTPTASNTIYSANQGSRPSIDLNMFEKKPGSAPVQPAPQQQQQQPQFPTVPSSPTPPPVQHQPTVPPSQPQSKPPAPGAVPVFPIAPTTQHSALSQQPAPVNNTPVPSFPTVPVTPVVVPTSAAPASGIPEGPSFAPVPIPVFHGAASDAAVPTASLSPSIPTPQFATLRPSQTQPLPPSTPTPDFPTAPTIVHSKTEPAFHVFPDPPKDVVMQAPSQPPVTQSKSEPVLPVFPDPPKEVAAPKPQFVETPLTVQFAEAETATSIPVPMFDTRATEVTPPENSNNKTLENAGQDTTPVNKQTDKLSKSQSNRSSLDSPTSSRLADIQRRKSARPIKEGHLWVKVGRLRKTWKIFWFVLEENSLSYFANPQSPKPTKSYPFSGETYAKDVPSKKADENIQFAFITGKKARRFEAESKEVKQEWIAAINSIGGQNKNGLKGSDTPIRKSFDSKMLDIDSDEDDEEALQIANLEIARVDVEGVN